MMEILGEELMNMIRTPGGVSFDFGSSSSLLDLIFPSDSSTWQGCGRQIRGMVSLIQMQPGLGTHVEDTHMLGQVE